MNSKKNDKLSLNPFQPLNIQTTSRNLKPQKTLTENTEAPHGKKADQPAEILHTEQKLMQTEDDFENLYSESIGSEAFEKTPHEDQKTQTIKKEDKKDPVYHNYNEQQVYPAKYTDSDNSEDEGMEDYKVGGYHPVHVGEIYLQRYQIMQKLGWGHFSTVWLAKDLKYNTFVALKVQKSAQHYLEAAYDEVEILQELEKHNYDPEWEESIKAYWTGNPSRIRHGIERDHSQVVQLLNSFIHHGPNGKHFVMVFEILGVNFLEIIKRYDYKGVPLPLVRKLTRQCLVGLDYMHRMCKIIHTDFKPENVVICLRDDEVNEIAKTGQLTTTKMFEH